MRLVDLVTFIAFGITIFGLGYSAGVWFARRAAKRRRRASSHVAPVSALAKIVESSHGKPVHSLDIVGYSVHTIYRSVAPLVDQVLRANGRVRLLALDPSRLSLAEKNKMEHPSSKGQSDSFLARTTQHIDDTVRALTDAAQIVRYQTGTSGSDLSFRFYDALPIYRGVIADDTSVASSYLEDLGKSARDFPMTISTVKTEFADSEDTRLRQWFSYLWKYRSRPHDVSAVVFDLYDTLVHVDPEARIHHQSNLANALNLSPAAFIAAWDNTSEASNRGELGSTADRLLAISDLTGVDRIENYDELAVLEDRFLRENARVAPDAIELLRGLRQRGYRIGILSNCSPSVQGTLSATGLNHLVDYALLSYAVGMIKPNPALFSSVAKELQSIPEHVIYVGDGAGDELNAASALGMRPVRVTWANSSGARPAGVASASSFLELAHIIDPEAEWHFG